MTGRANDDLTNSVIILGLTSQTNILPNFSEKAISPNCKEPLKNQGFHIFLWIN